ncbi:transcriptional activator of glycolytic enzymes-domain-containing protein, partial [Phlyctochytrium arcticum]
QEYATGINGQPSVREVEESLGNSWRKMDSDRRFFTRRKHLSKEVERLVATGLREDEAIDAMEAERAIGALSIDQYRTLLFNRAKSQA